MPALDYSDLTVMHQLAAELAGGQEPLDLDSLLERSAATHTSGTVTVYRPYYVAAQVLRRAPNTKRLREARGTVFDAPSETIAGLTRQQASEDEAWTEAHSDYAVPAGHEAESGTVARITF